MRAGACSTVLKNKVPDRPRMQLFRAVALYQQGKLDGASKGLNEIKHADVETTQKAEYVAPVSPCALFQNGLALARHSRARF